MLSFQCLTIIWAILQKSSQAQAPPGLACGNTDGTQINDASAPCKCDSTTCTTTTGMYCSTVSGIKCSKRPFAICGIEVQDDPGCSTSTAPVPPGGNCPESTTSWSAGKCCCCWFFWYCTCRSIYTDLFLNNSLSHRLSLIVSLSTLVSQETVQRFRIRRSLFKRWNLREHWWR